MIFSWSFLSLSGRWGAIYVKFGPEKVHTIQKSGKPVTQTVNSLLSFLFNTMQMIMDNQDNFGISSDLKINCHLILF